MPEKKTDRKDRMAVRIPKSMIAEVDRLVRDLPELNYNRQQFIESAIREKILALREVKIRGAQA